MLQPKPWEKTMTGRPLPVAGAETRTWRSVPRSGAGITIGLADTTSRSVMVGLPSEVGFEVGVPGAPCRSVKRRPALPDGGCHDGVKRNAVPVTTIWNHVPLCKGDHRRRNSSSYQAQKEQPCGRGPRNTLPPLR